MRFKFLTAILLALLGSRAIASAAPLPIDVPTRTVPVDFEREVLPILLANCAACHNRQKAEGGLSLESPRTILQGGEQGPAIVPGKSRESLLLKLAAHQQESFMPPSGNDVGARDLTSQELGLVQLWIDQGAVGSVTARTVRWQAPSAGYQPIMAVAVTPDGQYAACSRGNQLHVYHLPTATLVAQLVDPALDGAPHRDFIRSLAFDPAGDRLASGGFREIKLWRRPRLARAAEQAEDAPVVLATIAASGQLAATADGAGRLRAFEPASGKTLHLVNLQPSVVTAMALSADATLAYIANDQTLVVWNLGDGSHVAPPVKTPSPATAMAIDHGGQQLVTGHQDGLVRVWDADRLRVEGDDEQTPRGEIAISDRPITSLLRLPGEDGRFLAASEDGVARRFAIGTGKFGGELRHGAAIGCLAVSPDGRRIATCGDGRVVLWDSANDQQLAEMASDPRQAAQLAQLDSQLFFTKTGVDHARQDIKLYEGPERRVKTTAEAIQMAEQGREKAVKSLEEKRSAVEKAKAENKGEKAIEAAESAAAEAETAVQVAATIVERAKVVAERAMRELDQANADLAAREERLQKLEAEKAAATAAQEAARPLFSALTFTGDSQRLIAGSDDGSLFAFAADNGSFLETFVGHSGKLRAMAASDGVLLTAGDDRRSIVWNDPSQWQWERTIGADANSLSPSDENQLQGPSDRVLALDFSPDGKLLASGSGTASVAGQIAIWQVADGMLVRQLPDVHADSVLALRFSPDGQRLASAGADRQIKLFDVLSTDLQQTLAGHTAHVLGLSWNADGSRLVSCGTDQVLKLWDTREASLLRTMKGTTYQIGSYKGEVTSVSFIGASEQIVAASGDGTVRLHRSTSESDILTFNGSQSYQNAVAATPDGRALLAGGTDGILRIWTRLERSPQHILPPPAPDSAVLP